MDTRTAVPLLSAVLLASGCGSNEDCSLNGICQSDGTCRCIPAWKGHNCSVLSLLPAPRLAGFHPVDDGRNTSTWGGTVLRSDDGTYHMWASEMIQHCGINAWTENSRLVHAVSPSPLGPFMRRDVTFPVFSHEATAVRDPRTGEYVLFFTAHIPSGRAVCNCTDGSTTDKGCGGTDEEGATYVSWAKHPEGPWSSPLEVVSVEKRMSDTNLAPVLFEDGSLLGIWRLWKNGSWPRLVTATNYRDPETYVFDYDTPLFPEIGPDVPSSMGTEDPFLYRDENGYFHAVFHNMVPCPDYPCPEVAGGHAYSPNGRNWTYTGVAFNSSGSYEDGTNFTFLRRERPHLLFDSDGTTIVGLTSGVAYGGEAGDATFTFAQPVAGP